ncbi:MAG TPA: N-acetylmuramoyl-L-alanine amidase, partial [Longimicrobiales bacterium]|nr:N-acetylmuramoyl-L-alanine amidase [Longimicrobiales bacterium]
LAEDSAIERPKIGALEVETETRAANAAATGGRRDSGLLGAPVSLNAAYVQLVLGADTVRAPLALNLAVIDPVRPMVAAAADPVPVGGTNDGYVVGRPEPGGVSHYFWPNGTEFVVTGERAGDFRVQLTDDLTAYAAATELRLLPEGTPRPASLVSNVTISADTGFIDVRFPLNRKLPFWVEEGENTLAVWLYGATSATDWLIYGKREPLVERAWWDQPRNDVYRLNISLSKPVWGYQTFWNERGHLILRIRKPPAINAQSPLRGLLVTVDPGHGPPEGRWGPTRLTESQANLAIAFRLRDLIQAAGGSVQLTRTDSSAVGLYDRPAMSTRANADLFVSIHNNAVGDGVNPYTNHGTSTFFFHANSAALARAVQNELVNDLGLPDLGYVRASLAVVRWPTWMPAILTEALFFMMPVQEAALRNPAVIDRIARAHLRGMEAFLRARAR